DASRGLFAGLFGRRVRIGLVGGVDVDLSDSEPVQARLDLASHARTREPMILAPVHRIERLGRQLRPVAAARHPVADHRLAATAAVRIGCVEHRDAERPRGVHDPERLLLALALAEELRRRADAAEVAAAEDDARDLDFGPAEATTLHWRDSRSAGFSDACARR